MKDYYIEKISKELDRLLLEREKIDEDTLIEEMFKLSSELKETLDIDIISDYYRKAISDKNVPTEKQIELFRELEKEISKLYYLINKTESNIRIKFNDFGFLNKKKIMEKIKLNRIEFTVIPRYDEIIGSFIDIRNQVQHGQLCIVMATLPEEILRKYLLLIKKIFLVILQVDEIVDIYFIESLLPINSDVEINNTIKKLAKL